MFKTGGIKTGGIKTGGISYRIFVSICIIYMLSSRTFHKCQDKTQVLLHHELRTRQANWQRSRRGAGLLLLLLLLTQNRE